MKAEEKISPPRFLEGQTLKGPRKAEFKVAEIVYSRGCGWRYRGLMTGFGWWNQLCLVTEVALVKDFT